LSSDYQMSQHQQQSDFTNNNKKNNNKIHHYYHNSVSMYLQTIPPLIPIRTVFPTSMIDSFVPSQQHESIHFNKQVSSNSLSQDLHEQLNKDYSGQRRRPLKKTPYRRSLKDGQERGDCTNSSGCQPDLRTSTGETTCLSPDIMLGQMIRSTSVFQFTHRHPAGTSRSNYRTLRLSIYRTIVHQTHEQESNHEAISKFIRRSFPKLLFSIFPCHLLYLCKSLNLLSYLYLS